MAVIHLRFGGQAEAEYEFQQGVKAITAKRATTLRLIYSNKIEFDIDISQGYNRLPKINGYPTAVRVANNGDYFTLMETGCPYTGRAFPKIIETPAA